MSYTKKGWCMIHLFRKYACMCLFRYIYIYTPIHISYKVVLRPHVWILLPSPTKSSFLIQVFGNRLIYKTSKRKIQSLHTELVDLSSGQIPSRDVDLEFQSAELLQQSANGVRPEAFDSIPRISVASLCSLPWKARLCLLSGSALGVWNAGKV